MLYYLGKGTEFKKEDCKEYKKLDAALRAREKDNDLNVWDENGTIYGTEYIPDTNTEQKTPQENTENVENASNEGEATNTPTEQENGENKENTKPENETGQQENEQDDKIIIPQGKMRVTVICDGSLNIRRSAAWGNDNICGRAIRGQTYFVKEIHVVDGKKMVRTIGDLYLSGESEHVQFEQL